MTHESVTAETWLHPFGAGWWTGFTCFTCLLCLPGHRPSEAADCAGPPPCLRAWLLHESCTSSTSLTRERVRNAEAQASPQPAETTSACSYNLTWVLTGDRRQIPPDGKLLLCFSTPQRGLSLLGPASTSHTPTSAHRARSHLLAKSQIAYAGTSGVPVAPLGHAYGSFPLLAPASWLFFTQCTNRSHLPCSSFHPSYPWSLRHRLHQLSCSIHTSVEKMDFPHEESAIHWFVSVCLFTEYSVTVPGTGVTSNGERESPAVLQAAV